MESQLTTDGREVPHERVVEERAIHQGHSSVTSGDKIAEQRNVWAYKALALGDAILGHQVGQVSSDKLYELRRKLVGY